MVLTLSVPFWYTIIWFSLQQASNTSSVVQFVRGASYSEKLTQIIAWICNYNSGFMWNTITHPYINFNRNFIKPLQLGYGWVTTFHCLHECNFLFIPDAFQQVGDTKEVGTSDRPERDAYALDFNCSTDVHITQLDGDKSTASATYRVETSSLKQIMDTVFQMQISLKQISEAILQRQMTRTDDEECRNSWMMVAMVIDRLLLLVFTLLTIIVSIVLLLNHPTYTYEHIYQPLDTLDYQWRTHLHQLT